MYSTYPGYEAQRKHTGHQMSTMTLAITLSSRRTDAVNLSSWFKYGCWAECLCLVHNIVNWPRLCKTLVKILSCGYLYFPYFLHTVLLSLVFHMLCLALFTIMKKKSSCMKLMSHIVNLNFISVISTCAKFSYVTKTLSQTTLSWKPQGANQAWLGC